MWYIKEYNDLELNELEQILKLRQSIFIIEQQSFFEDIDGNDSKALHIFNKEDCSIWAYTRILVYDDCIILGRITVDKNYRGNGSGRHLLDYALEYLLNEYADKNVHIVAMSYLKDFYYSYGFETVSDVYFMDNDPHENMILYR